MSRMIYVNRGHEFVKVQEPLKPNNCNFVIVCKYGDWSGFRFLDECVKQFIDAGIVINGKLQCEDCFYEQNKKKCAEEKIILAKQIIKMLKERIAHYEKDEKTTN